jgi:hypothetical protein
MDESRKRIMLRRARFVTLAIAATNAIPACSSSDAPKDAAVDSPQACLGQQIPADASDAPQACLSIDAMPFDVSDDGDSNDEDSSDSG